MKPAKTHPMKRRAPIATILAILLILLILAILVSLPLFALPLRQPTAVRAEEGTEDAREELEDRVDDLLDELDLTALQNFLDKLTEFGGISLKDTLRRLITGDGALDYPSLFSALFSSALEEGRALIPSFAVILAVTLLCAAVDWMKNGVLQGTSSDIIHFAAYLSVGAVVLSLLVGLVQTAFGTVRSLKTQMDLAYPVLLTLMAASGGSVSAGIFRPAVAFMSGGISALFSDLVLPAAVVIVILTFIGHLSDSVRTEKLGDLFKSVVKWLMGLSLGLFGVFVTVQGISSAQYDGLSLRAVKYVLSGSVPLVGPFLSGGVEFVIAGSALLKNALGTFAVFLLAGTILRPVLTYCAFQLFLRLAAAATEPIGGRIPAFLSSLAKSCNYILAAVLCVAFLYFTTLLLVICSSGVFF